VRTLRTRRYCAGKGDQPLTNHLKARRKLLKRLSPVLLVMLVLTMTASSCHQTFNTSAEPSTVKSTLKTASTAQAHADSQIDGAA
jgi:hypothetical protein